MCPSTSIYLLEPISLLFEGILRIFLVFLINSCKSNLLEFFLRRYSYDITRPLFLQPLEELTVPSAQVFGGVFLTLLSSFLHVRWCIMIMMDHYVLIYVSRDSIGGLIIVINAIVRCIHGYICCVGFLWFGWCRYWASTPPSFIVSYCYYFWKLFHWWIFMDKVWEGLCVWFMI